MTNSRPIIFKCLTIFMAFSMIFIAMPAFAGASSPSKSVVKPPVLAHSPIPFRPESKFKKGFEGIGLLAGSYILVATAAVVLPILKVSGVLGIAFGWVWVLSPLWILGIIVVLSPLFLVGFIKGKKRKKKSNA